MRIQPERCTIILESLGKPLKKSANGWTNYLCPSCRDGKKDHFWVSPEMNLAYCHKCLKTLTITRSHEISLIHKWGSMSNLKEAIKGVFGRKALTSGASTETVSLQYTPLLLDQLHANYDVKLLADLSSPIREEVKKY